MSFATPVSQCLSPGDRCGRWTIAHAIGSGAFGTVYAVADPSGRRAALKTLAGPPGDELRALSRLAHPGVVSLLDSGGGHTPWMVMELATGLPLCDAAGEIMPLAVQEVAFVGGVLCSALAAAHDAGVHHGDVKPQNVMWDAEAMQVKLVDFGLSGSSGGGTHSYASPEVLAGGAPSCASDMYGLALCLWALLHGRAPPTDAGSLLQRAAAPLQCVTGPAWLADAVRSCLVPDAAARPSAEALLDVFVAHGVSVPAPDASLVRRRASAIYVVPGTLEKAFNAYLQGGVGLGLTGAPGSGRSASLVHLAHELCALGRSWVRLVPTTAPWQTVHHALEQGSLPGAAVVMPLDLSAQDRAGFAVHALLERSQGPLHLLVDDFDALDPQVASVVRRLSKHPAVSLAVTSGKPTDLDLPVHEVPAIDVATLAKQLVGVSDPRLIKAVADVSQGHAAHAVDAVVGAVAGGAMVWRRSAWVVCVSELERLVAAGGLTQRAVEGLSDEALAVGGVLAAARTVVSVADLSALSSLPKSTVRHGLDELHSLSWIARENQDSARCTVGSAREALLRSHPDPRHVHVRLRDAWMSANRPPAALLGWYLVGANDGTQIRELGPACLARTGDVCPGELSRLAGALWSVAPWPGLALAVCRAHIDDDQLDDALIVAESAYERLADETARAQLQLSIARTHSKRGDWRQALAAVHAARVLGEVPELVSVVASVNFRAGIYGPAIQAAKSLCDCPPPTDHGALGDWLSHRAIWAEAAFEIDGADAAVNVLAGVPIGLGGDLPAGALLDGVRGRLLWHAGDIRGAADAFARATASQGLLGSTARARLCNNAGLANYQMGLLDAAVQSWEQALVGFERGEQWADQARVLVNLCQGLREAGRWKRARQVGEAAVELAQDHGFAHAELVARGNLGDALVAIGAFADAEASYCHAQSLASASGDAAALAELARRRAEVAAMEVSADALDRAREAVALNRADGTVGDLGRSLMLQGIASLRAHLPVELDAVVADVSSRLRGAGAAGDLAWARRWAAEGMLECGRASDAVELGTLAVSWAMDAGNAQLKRDAMDVVARGRRAGRRHPDQPLDRLVRAMIVLSRAESIGDYLQGVADSAVSVLGVERACVIAPEPRGAYTVLAAAGGPGEPSRSVVERAVARRREVLATDLEERHDLRLATSVMQMDLRAALCVPVLDEDALLCLIYVDSSYAVGTPLTESADLLRHLAEFVVGRMRAHVATRRVFADHQASLRACR